VDGDYSVDETDFGCPDQPAMGNPDRMDGCLNFLAPVIEKPAQYRETRRMIAGLPDELLDQPGMVGSPVADFRGHHSITAELSQEIRVGHRIPFSAAMGRYIIHDNGVTFNHLNPTMILSAFYRGECQGLACPQ
jgi:hypothetical protein